MNQATAEPVREMIMIAARGLNKDAPVEPKTGDVYFPGAKLYLPNPQTMFDITYNYYPGDGADFQPELNVSTDPIWGNSQLYSANDVKELFELVPRFQACTRGIKVVFQQIPQEGIEGLELKHTVSLSSGEVAYVYQETACPELNELSEQFKNLQSY